MTRITPSRLLGSSRPVRCPPDKSVTHRAFLFALLSSGISRVRDPLLGQDCLASLAAARCLGATSVPAVERASASISNEVLIRGFGVRPFGAPRKDGSAIELDCGNSGTTMRLLTGLLAAQPGRFRLIGDESLSRRPMGRVVEPLTGMGAGVAGIGMVSAGGIGRTACHAPLEIGPVPERGLRPLAHVSRVASAQVKSAVLLAGLFCEEGTATSVEEPVLSRDHTERMLRGMGARIVSEHAGARALARIEGMRGGDLEPLDLAVGGDPSSAAFWVCAAILQARRVCLDNVLLNPTRLGFLRALQAMGAAVRATSERAEGGEEIGRIEVEPVGALRGIEISAAEAPSLIDEIPVLALPALWAGGTTVFRGVQELRVKESDRLQAVIDLVTSMGGRAWAEAEDLHIEGQGGVPRGPVAGEWRYATLSDHRLAMAGITAADALHREIVLDDAECIRVSYPSFFQHREALSK